MGSCAQHLSANCPRGVSGSSLLAQRRPLLVEQDIIDEPGLEEPFQGTYR